MSTMRAILITGGASGIGRATARLFGARGWRVGIADIDDARATETAASLPGVHHRYHLDVRDRGAWEEVLERFVHEAGGRLDVLHNNAGIALGGAFADASPEDLDRVVAVNLTGVMNGARAGFRYLAATPGSCLLNTASASAIYGSAGLAAYSATKFAVRGLSEALDGEWHGAGVRVRTIVPGFIDTPLLDQVVPNSNRSIRETVRAARLELTPVDRVAEAAWRAVHGKPVHTTVGATAQRMARAARWAPGLLRRQMRRSSLGEGA